MASINFQGTRVNNADALTRWTADGVSSLSLEPDWYYQGTGCISGLIKTTEVGLYYASTAQNLGTTPGNGVWLAKFNQTNKNAIDGNGIGLRIGSTTAAYHLYYIFTAATYPLAGGFQIVPIDPNITGFRSGVTGTPNFASTTIWYLQSDANATAKTQNLGMDAVDWVPTGKGLILTGSSGIFENFVEFDEGNSTNRYGVVTTRDGIIYVLGTLTIGSASVATTFNDTNKVIVWPDGRYFTGFAGFRIDNRNAGTSVSMSSCTFNGRGSFKGTATQSADTRPNFEVTGTVGSGAYILSNNFNGFNKFNLTSSANIQECVFTNPNQMTQSGATINGCTFEGPTVSASVAFLRANNLDLITNCSFNGTSSFGHAIQITTAATYSFDGNTFSGYSGTPGANLTPNSGDQNAEIYNNSGGYVYINISNGDTPSVRNGVGASTELSNPVLLTLTGILSGSEVTITSGSDSTVLYHLESVTGTGQAIYQYNYSAGTIVDILIFEVTKDPNLSNIYDYTLGSINSTIPIRQIPDRVYTNPLGS